MRISKMKQQQYQKFGDSDTSCHTPMALYTASEIYIIYDIDSLFLSVAVASGARKVILASYSKGRCATCNAFASPRYLLVLAECNLKAAQGNEPRDTPQPLQIIALFIVDTIEVVCETGKPHITRMMEDTSPNRPLSLHDEEALKAMTRFPTLRNVKTICVTGGAGFIGSWFLRNMALTYPEYNFVCLDIFEPCASLNNLRALDHATNFTIVTGDIRDSDAVKECLAKHNVDVIVYFAANSHVDLSFDLATAFCGTNITGTVTLLEAARERGITAPLRPTNPYSGSKAAADMMVCAFARSFGLPVVIVRSNNVYGPNQFPEKIIPKFVTLILLGEKVPLYGSGTYRRRYLYAGDAANAFNVIMHKGAVGEIYNVGSYDEMSNVEVVQRIVRAVVTTDCRSHSTNEADISYWIRQTPDRPFMDQRYGVDFSKLRALGWFPQVSIEDGLQRTVDWYRCFGNVWWGDISSYLGAGQFRPRQEVTSPKPIMDMSEDT
ncbi:hypothetical protein NPX13_g1529 [Xylaria arbuscula]|uniref:NAD(P)-binding domain-containing protein n=1 Tax=Xylaria arbuscula TaxID=114810 RepID=A0A9W8TPK1_9PEZI|nr:hypothetical protein NPX13_g1529 [Xylaria arbuscula]